LGFILLILFIAVPIIEIGLFIEVGGRLGLWPTLGVVILTAMVGTALLRQQGLETLRRVQESLAQDRLPVAEMFDGLCLLFAGALLLTPGFMTDAFGFLLFVPALRTLAAGAIGRAIMRHGQVHVSGFSSAREGSTGPQQQGPRTQAGTTGPTVIDGDFEEIVKEAPRINPESTPGNTPEDKT